MAALPKTFTVSGIIEVQFTIEVDMVTSKDEAMEKVWAMGSEKIRENASISEVEIDLLSADENE